MKIKKTLNKKFINVSEVLKQFENKILFTGDIKNNKIFKPSIDRVGLQMAAPQPIKKFTTITSTVLWGTKESIYIDWSKREEEKIEVIKRLFELEPPLLILTAGFKQLKLVKQVAKKYKTTVVQTALHSNHMYLAIAGWINKQLATYTLIHGTVVVIEGIGILIRGESGIGKSEVALQLIKKEGIFIADDAVDVANIGNRLFGKPAEIAENFIEVRGIGLMNVSKMFGVIKIRKSSTIHLIIDLVKSEDIKREYFERIGKETRTENLLGINIPIYKIPVTFGRDVSNMVEAAVSDYKLKLDGYNSADEYMKKYKKIILRDK